MRRPITQCALLTFRSEASTKLITESNYVHSRLKEPKIKISDHMVDYTVDTMKVDMHYFVFVLVLISVVKCDEGSYEKEIQSLPEDTRRTLLDKVAERLLNNINGTSAPAKAETDIPDDKLSESSKLVQRVIEEEKVNLKNASEKDKGPQQNPDVQPRTASKSLTKSQMISTLIAIDKNTTTAEDIATTQIVANTETTTKAVNIETAPKAANLENITKTAHKETTTDVSAVKNTEKPYHIATTIMSESNLSIERPTTTTPIKQENSSTLNTLKVPIESLKAENDLSDIASKIPKDEILKHLLKRFGYNTQGTGPSKVYEVFEQKNNLLPFSLKNIDIKPTPNANEYKLAEGSSLEDSSSSSQESSFETSLIADKINVNRGVKPELMKTLLKFMGDVYNKKSVLRNIAGNINPRYLRRKEPPAVERFRAYKPTNLDTDYFDREKIDMYRRGNIQRTRTGNKQIFIRTLNILQNPHNQPKLKSSAVKSKIGNRTSVVKTTLKSVIKKNETNKNTTHNNMNQKPNKVTVPIKGPKVGLMKEANKIKKSRRYIDFKTENDGQKLWLNSFVTVTRDMIEKDSDTFTDYDWLGTTVDVLAALAKLNDLIQKEEDNFPLNKDDKEVLDFTRTIFKTAFLGKEEQTQNKNGRRRSNNKVQYMIIQNKDASESIDTNNVLSQLLNYYADKNQDPIESQNQDIDLNVLHTILSSATHAVKENKLNKEFKTFLIGVGKASLHLHLAVMQVTKDAKLHDQAFYFQLKENFLEHANRRELIGVLVHMFTADFLQSVGRSYRSGMSDDPDLLGEINKKEFDKAVDSVAFTIRFLRSIVG